MVTCSICQLPVKPTQQTAYWHGTLCHASCFEDALARQEAASAAAEEQALGDRRRKRSHHEEHTSGKGGNDG